MVSYKECSPIGQTCAHSLGGSMRQQQFSATLCAGLRLFWRLPEAILFSHVVRKIMPSSQRCSCPNSPHMWMLPYMAKETLQMWLRIQPSDLDIILHYSDRPHLITLVLKIRGRFLPVSEKEMGQQSRVREMLCFWLWRGRRGQKPRDGSSR